MVQGVPAGFPAVDALKLYYLIPIHENGVPEPRGIDEIGAAKAVFLHERQGDLVDGAMLIVKGKNDGGGAAICLGGQPAGKRKARQEDGKDQEQSRSDGVVNFR